LPVPPGFTISTKVCEYFYKNNKKIPKKIKCKSFEELLKKKPNVIIEVASVEACKDYAEKVLKNKIDFVCLSVCSFADRNFFKRISNLVKKIKNKIYIPTGAIAGIDAISSASISKELKYVKLIQRKPPKALLTISESKKIKNEKGVESVEYGEKWISRFEHFMIFLRGFILIFGVVLFSGMILIISNTIKLSIYSRKDEIDLMTLLGATHAFIKAPLLLEGVFQGVAGALLSLVSVKLIHLYVVFWFQGSLDSIFRGIDFQYLTNPIIYSVISTGIIIGVLGSSLSANQFLNRRYSE